VDVKLLLDENISPKLGEMLRNQDGVDAVHVLERGLLQAPDHNVLERAYAEDRVLVTKNVDDFVKLARARDMHPGIILLEDGDLVRDEQLRVVRAAVVLHRMYTFEQPNSLSVDELSTFFEIAREKYPQHFAVVLLGSVTGLRPSTL
jgi:predicted nuclease of predicted toxin-antitoxin system